MVRPPPGDLPTSRIKAVSLTSPALAGGLFTTSTTWESHVLGGLLKVLQKSVRGVIWNLVLDSLPVAFYPKVVVTCCDTMLQEKMRL